MRTARFLKNIVAKLLESLSSKIYLTHIVSIVIISLSFTGFFIHYQKKSRTDLLINKGELIAVQLAENARIGVFAENVELLLHSLHSVMHQEEILAVKIFTDKGRLLINERKAGNSKGWRTIRQAAETEQKIMQQLLKSRTPTYLPHERTIDFWAPIQSETHYSRSEASFFNDSPDQSNRRTIGFICLELGKKQLRESFRTILLDGALITAVFLISALFATFLVTKSITRPLKRLKEGVDALGTGASIEEIPVETNDEVGKLAAAFNNMADSLKVRDREKAQLAEQLLHAQKMEAVGTLAGGVAHDFNNMLTAITGYCTLLQDDLQGEYHCSGYVAEILYAAERAASLTRRLLTFSRKQPIKPVIMNLNSTILDINKLLLRFINESIDFRIDLSREELFVRADEGHVEQVLINLVTNARDAMPDGGVLTISTGIAESGGAFSNTDVTASPVKYARMTVADTGTGIDADIKDRIFDPFFTTKDIGKGTGLGLSIVYGIIRQHNGFIEVDSVPGKGTWFTAYLPLTEPLEENGESGGFSLPVGGNNETVLIAEDDFAVRMLGKHLMSRFGYNVIEAVDGEDAIRKFIENKDSIQVLLLDVIMPKKNGRQVYDEVKRIRPDIKVLFMSGYESDIISKQGMLEEGLNFIAKPLHVVELLTKLRAAISDESTKNLSIE
jgi:signal transduction histidine kinase/CheY-like chemotaxis protein